MITVLRKCTKKLVFRIFWDIFRRKITFLRRNIDYLCMSNYGEIIGPLGNNYGEIIGPLTAIIV